MVASTDIKFYVHTNNNAPQLQNAYGSMINVLDACLVNGINIGQVSSLTASGSEITATFGTAHNLLSGQIVKITGASQDEFNGEYRIDVKSSTSITYKLDNAPTLTVATGVISCSLAPLGWEKPFSSNHVQGGGKAAYRSTNETLTARPYLRVIDEIDPAWSSTYAKYAKVGLVESMTDIDTMGGFQTPFDSISPSKNWVGSGSGSSAYNGWAKWHYAVLNGIRNASGSQTQTQVDSSTPTNGIRQWFVIGNSDFFYVLNTVTPLDDQYLFYGCGVVEKSSKTDEDMWFLASNLSYTTAATTYQLYNFNNLAYQLDYSATPTILLYKTLSRLAEDRCFLTCIKTARARDALIYSGGGNYILNTGDINGQPLIPPVFLGLEGASTRVIGCPPALYWLLRDKPFSDMQLTSNGDRLLLGKRVMSNTSFGQVMFDLGGEV